MPDIERPIANHPHEIANCVAEFLKLGDLEGIVSMFHPECQIHFPPGEPPKQGLDGVREVFKDFVIMRPILLSKVAREAINGDIAIIQANWRFEDDEGQLIAEGSSTEVARRLSNGGWGYFIDCPMGVPELK